MLATLKSAYEVSLPCTPHMWKIPSKDVISMDGNIFVKLCTRNSSLSSLIGNVGGFLCLTRSDGYKALMKLRNHETEIQNAELQKEEAALAGECNLFDEVKKIKKRISRSDAARERANRSRTVDVELELDNCDTVVVTMLRPVHTSDHIYIKFVEDNVSYVLHWLRHHSFSEHKRPRNPDNLPKGVYRQSNKFMVVYTAADGSTKRKRHHDIESALAFHADPAAADDAGDDDEAESELLDVAPEGGA